MTHHSENKTIAVLGIDLAKQSFQLHGVNAQGSVVLKRNLTRKNASLIHR